MMIKKDTFFPSVCAFLRNDGSVSLSRREKPTTNAKENEMGAESLRTLPLQGSHVVSGKSLALP